MGAMPKLFSSSSYDEPSYSTNSSSSPKLPNPDPYNFIIKKHKVVNNLLLLKVKYPDCTNYEGNKIMVYECTLDDINSQSSLDPHFSNSTKFHSPIARFQPTKEGWKMAQVFAMGWGRVTKIDSITT